MTDGKHQTTERPTKGKRDVRLLPSGGPGDDRTVRLLALAEGYAMVRRPYAMPFVMTEKEWQRLPLSVTPQ